MSTLYLLFELGADRYALAAGDVAEVLPLVAWKEIPGVPHGLAGAIDYRGAPVPVVDLAVLALGRASARRVSTRVFIARYPLAGGRTRLLGLVAERATEMLRRGPEEFQPSGVRADGARYLGPVTSDERGLIQRVSVAELLSAEVRAALWPEEAGAA